MEEITAENFNQYFFDVRKHRPKPGQIMAKFQAIAVLGDGPEKMDLVRLIQTDKIYQAVRVVQKIHCAREPECYTLLKQMCQDLLAGMTPEEVCKKDYEYVLRVFYYTNRECVPANDPHWETIQLLKLEENENTYKCEIHL